MSDVSEEEKLTEACSENNRCQAWNEWEERPGTPSFEDAVLDGLNIVGADLEEGDFIRTSMERIVIEECNMKKAHLSDSWLDYSLILRTNLTQANVECNLNYASLYQVDLIYAYLDGIFERTHFNQVNFSNSKICGNFKEANLIECNFVETIFFTGPIKVSGNFTRAHLIKCDFEQADLTGINFREAYLRESKNLTPQQIAQCKDISKISGLSPSFLDEVRNINPELFENQE